MVNGGYIADPKAYEKAENPCREVRNLECNKKSILPFDGAAQK
jgi:hypothetical protein